MIQKITLTGWELGYISAAGELATQGGTGSTSDYVEMVSGETYTIRHPGKYTTGHNIAVRFALYDENKKFVSRILDSEVHTATYNGYMRITVSVADNSGVTVLQPTDAFLEEVYVTSAVMNTITPSGWTWGYITNTGVLDTSGATAQTCDFFPIVNGATYKIVCDGSTETRFAIYDTDKTFVERLLATSEYTATADGYARITVQPGQVATNAYISTDADPMETPTEYAITIAETTNGTITTSASTAAEGATITLIIAPSNGYKLDTLAVTDASGNIVTVSNNSFTMPASPVTVTATFAESTTDDGNGDSGGETVTPSVDGKYTLPWLVVQKANQENALKFIGKKYLSLGDSIVWNDLYRKGYQHYVVERYGMVHTNHGVSGGTVVSTLSAYKQLDFTDVALVTIGFGVNDARAAVPLGEIGNYADTKHDTTTFYGAYRALLDKIYTENPECRVILLTPLQRLEVNAFGCDTENVNGNKLVDFADAVIALGEMYATPVCDMYRNSGLHQKNLAYYTTEGVHPEDAGYLRMANLILNAMDKF